MLRHAAGYKLAGDGHDTRSIQDYLGHKNIQHTVRYTELSPTRFKDFWRDWLMVPSPWLAAAMIAALAVMSFAPIKFLHPLRVRHWRVLNIALLAAWAALAFLAVINDLAPGPYVTWPLVAIAIYFFGAGLLRRLA